MQSAATALATASAWGAYLSFSLPPPPSSPLSLSLMGGYGLAGGAFDKKDGNCYEQEEHGSWPLRKRRYLFHFFLRRRDGSQAGHRLSQ